MLLLFPHQQQKTGLSNYCDSLPASLPCCVVFEPMTAGLSEFAFRISIHFAAKQKFNLAYSRIDLIVHPCGFVGNFQNELAN